MLPKILLLFHMVLLCILSWQTSLNRTEVGHLGASVYFYETFRFDVFHVNPPLTRMIVGLPIRLLGPEYSWKSYSPRPQDRSEWGLGNAFILANTPEKIHRCIFLARCSLIPILLLGGYFGYRLANEIFGPLSGVLFLIFWTFSPLILGWGATICPDVCAASIGIIGIYTFRQWLQSPSWWHATIAGLCLGLMVLTKLTWLTAFPLWLILWLIWIIPHYIVRRKIKPDESTDEKHPIASWQQMVCIFLIAIYTINMGYTFDGSFRFLREYQFISQTLSGIKDKEFSWSTAAGNRFSENIFGYIPVPFPAELVQGIDTQRWDFERGIESYLCGEYSQHGWWNYYLYVVVLKEPAGGLCLAALTVILFIFFRKYRVNWRDEVLIIVPLISLFFIVSSQTGFSLHPRYLIPMLPLMYLWMSRLGRSFSKFFRPVPIFATLLLVWFVSSSMYYYPHSISYFNEIAGGPQLAPKYLLGSNIDWGQNAYFLKHWCATHSEANPIRIAYFCAESPERLGIKGVQQIKNPLESGWYAIGVHELYSSSGRYQPFQKITPVDSVGYSIYIYHLSESDIAAMKEGTMNSGDGKDVIHTGGER